MIKYNKVSMKCVLNIQLLSGDLKLSHLKLKCFYAVAKLRLGGGAGIGGGESGKTTPSASSRRSLTSSERRISRSLVVNLLFI